MHGWMHPGWGGGGFGLIFMFVPLALLIVLAVVLVRWLSGDGEGGDRRGARARAILDERYARGEIDREEYLRRRNDIAGDSR